MLTPELAGRADLREGCPYGKAEKVHAGVPSGGGGAGAGYGSADRARGRGDRRGCATAGSLGPAGTRAARSASEPRSEEHTSELQSRGHLVCRLLLEKKKKTQNRNTHQRGKKTEGSTRIE